MKKTLFTFLLLFAATAMNAQGIVKGDMDGDGEVTITDVTSAVDVILGKAPKQLVKPYNVDNTLIVGTWRAPDGTSFTLNEDGSIEDYPDAATYKLRYYLGTLTMYNASGKTVKVMGVVEVEKRHLLLLDYATGAVAYYYYDRSGSIDGRDYVDLGLPSGTLWATCNVGASSPEDYGDYFAWGETSAKTMYNWSTYFDTKDNGNTFNKYNNNDGLTILEPEDDAAYKNWGPAWRMPSKDQIDELINSNYTTTEWTTQNGVQGRLITSKSNGNSIFLPAAGVRTISYLVEVGSDGYYWSRTLLESDPGGAWFLGLTSNGINWGDGMRPNGFSVRPVRLAPPAEVTAVDLGLPSGTLWANMNVGASSPEDYGDYFAWGETKPYDENGKAYFDWNTYKWCNGTDDTMTKYCNNSSYGNDGFTDDKTELDPEDDAAYVNWGPAWRMPSEEQLEELVNSNYTTTEWTTQNGVQGRLITSKSNGNSIFLPATGFSRYGYFYGGGRVAFWSRTLYESYQYNAWALISNSSRFGTDSGYRFLGFTVRPVCLPEISLEVSSSSLSFASLGGSNQVSINCNGSWTASSSESWCAVSPASGTGDGSLTITVSENTSTDSRSATVTVTADALTRTITVTQDGKAADNTPAEVTAVDLGLPSGTLWANMNVGASSPEDYGDYFAWGETIPYAENGKTIFYWSTYKWCNGSDDTMTKYCTNSSYGYDGFSDDKKELDPEDDAAYVNWGSVWRMPSKEQFDELINTTTTEWITTESGVSGWKITSLSNSNFIFLPAAGARYSSTLFDAGSGGDYWSRALNSDEPKKAGGLYFSSNGVYTDYGFRYYGFSVRPVRLSE